MSHPATVIAQELRKREPDDRAAFLTALIAHAAASLVLIQGEREAAECVYRLADNMVGCTGEDA